MTTKLNFKPNKTVPPPSKFWLFTEPSRALVGLGLFFAYQKKLLKAVPKGEQNPVLVLPGFMTSDHSTAPLRKFLSDCNHDVYAWELGINFGKSFYIYQLIKRVEKIYADTGKKVHLVGWSLGGVYAREIARNTPESVAQVITMGSPFGGIFEKNSVQWLHKLIHGKSYKDVPSNLTDRMHIPPPVPVTAIYSKEDGIVSWEYCREFMEGNGIQNIEVKGSHFGMGHNPAVLYCVADRLHHLSTSRKPFEPSGLLSWLFPEFD